MIFHLLKSIVLPNHRNLAMEEEMNLLLESAFVCSNMNVFN